MDIGAYEKQSTPSAEEQLQGLLTMVQDLFTSGALNLGLFKSLTKQLEGSLNKLNQGDTNVAGNRLSAFINHVESLINTGALSEAQGDPLLSAARAALELIRS